MKMEIGFGTTPQPLEVPDKNLVGVLKPNKIELGLVGAEAVKNAIENPIGTPRLEKIISPGEKIAIITSDITRPVPSYTILPPLLDELNSFGVKDEDIVIVFALGSHRVHTEEEMRKLVGDAVFERVETIDGAQDGYVHMGDTKHGTPVDVCRVVAEADRRICLGNIEYHYFAGYSGGAKAIMPGVSTREAIQSNHSLMVEENSIAGKLDGNPVRIDLEEAIEYCPIDFIVNVVLNEEKKIINAVAGHFVDAHRVGCKFLDKLYRKDIDERADIVVVSQGGAPKDLNLYQTQKALDNAKHAIKDGGIVVLVGSCKEGMGEHVFEEWMEEAKKPEDLIVRVKENFQLGGHKAAAIALVLEKADIYMVSEMPADFVREIFMEPFTTVQDALDKALEVKGEDATVLVMPYGGSTLPVVK